MRTYDIVAVLTPDETPEQTAAHVEGFKKILVDDGANIVVEEAWGRRRLAYPIAKKREGIYHYWQVEAKAETVAEIERKMRLADEVIRHLAVRTDDERRRSVKLAKRREEKAAAKPKKVRPEPAEAAPPEEA